VLGLTDTLVAEDTAPLNPSPGKNLDALLSANLARSLLLPLCPFIASIIEAADCPAPSINAGIS